MEQVRFSDLVDVEDIKSKKHNRLMFTTNENNYQALKKVFGKDYIVTMPVHGQSVKECKDFVGKVLYTNKIVKVIDVTKLADGWSPHQFLARGGVEKGLIEFARKFSLVIKRRKGDIADPSNLSTVHFRALGHKRDCYYFYSFFSSKVCAFLPEEMEGDKLLELAPYAFFSKRGGTHSNEELKSSLMQACFQAGFFMEERVKGLGLWQDTDRVLWNNGDRIYDGCKTIPQENVKSPSLYEKIIGVESSPHKESLSRDEINSFIKLCQMVPFSSDNDRAVFVAWLFSALMSGVLPSRASLLIVCDEPVFLDLLFNNLIKKLFGEFCFTASDIKETNKHFIGSTSKGHAVPFLINKFEGIAQKHYEYMYMAMNFARDSFKDKGLVKCPFCIGSTKTDINLKDYKKFFKIVKIDWEGFGSKEYEFLSACSNLLTHTFHRKFLRTIINHSSHARVQYDLVSQVLKKKSSRSSRADLYAFLSVGRYCYKRVSNVTQEQIDAAVKAFGTILFEKHFWKHKGTVFLRKLLEMPFKVEGSDGSHIKTVNEYATDIRNKFINGLSRKTDPEMCNACEVLESNGIRYVHESQALLVAYRSTKAMNFLGRKNQQARNELSRDLLALPGVYAMKKSVHFFGIKKNMTAIAIPFVYIEKFGNYEEIDVEDSFGNADFEIVKE